MPVLPNPPPFQPAQHLSCMYSLVRSNALCVSLSMFLCAYFSDDQKAMVTVMESPKWAKVALSPLNLAWTFFMGSTQ